jgi:hypothetical protein
MLCSEFWFFRSGFIVVILACRVNRIAAGCVTNVKPPIGNALPPAPSDAARFRVNFLAASCSAISLDDPLHARRLAHPPPFIPPRSARGTLPRFREHSP